MRSIFSYYMATRFQASFRVFDYKDFDSSMSEHSKKVFLFFLLKSSVEIWGGREKKVRRHHFLSIRQNKKHLPSDFRRSIDALHRISFVFILPRFPYMVAALYK